MAKVKRINHIAVLVDDLDTTLKFWRDGLGLELSQVQDIPAEMAQIAFFPTGEIDIELVKPTSADTDLSRFLEKHGPGMHHICLEVDDIVGMLAQLEAQDIQLINEEPKLGADGHLYAFVHPKSANGVMVELYQLP
jgi:methylmalonyl-CoA/ethylmalonyl-CoA epimerase